MLRQAQQKADQHLDAIYYATKDMVFSKNMAAKIVGSRTKLEDLVGKGHIRAEKKGDHQHGKWMCNAADVLRYAQSMN